LRRLEQHDPRQSRIVECRFFGGMTIQDTAEALGVSPATVKRGWAMAQAWLYRELASEVDASP
jgi:DNA-directed RNA polymerase specialized sigma24 family protein